MNASNPNGTMEIPHFSVSVIIMAYNEAASLPGVIEEVRAAVTKLGLAHEILIVDDGSTDGTGRLAEEAAAHDPAIQVIHHPENRGLGGVYRTGLGAAAQEVVFFMAADGQPIPELYLQQFLPLLEGHHLVLGQLTVRRDPWLSKLFSGVEKVLLRTMFPGVPKLQGPFMFRREILDTIQLLTLHDEDRSWVILWELFARAKQQGYAITTCRTDRRPRRHGVSKGNTWRNAFLMMKALARLKWRMMFRALPPPVAGR